MNNFRPEFSIDGVNFFWGGNERKQLTYDTINFDYRKDDILIAGYPRAGTTFRRQMIWLVAYDADVERAKAEQLRDRVPSLDRYTTEDGDLTSTEKVAQMTSTPRVMFTHLPFNLLKKAEEAGTKVIYLLRNPKDTVVSTYHARRYFLPQIGEELAGVTFDESLRLLSGEFDRGNMIDHAYSYWKYRHNQNFLFLHYEQDKSDYGAAVRKVADFLGKTLSNEQVQDIVDFISFDNFKKHQNEETVVAKGRDKSLKDEFVRRGAVGEWKDYFSEEQNAAFDKLIEEKCQGEQIPWIYE